MNIERAYVGAWFPRTSLHLRELYRFLNDGVGVQGLDKSAVAEHLRALNVSDVSFHEEQDLDYICAACGEIKVTIIEDGLILLESLVEDPLAAIQALETFYSKQFGPALSYLFSRGAPLPKSLTNIEEVYPIPLVVRDISESEVRAVFALFADNLISTVSTPNAILYSGSKVLVVNVSGGYFAKEGTVEEFLEYLIFFREFESQLQSYLMLHRNMWDDIASIRESTSLRYKEFPLVRERILGFLTSISFVKARLSQMMDILVARESSVSQLLRDELPKLGMNRFVVLRAEQSYIDDLWKMTEEYAQGTLGLLDSLFSENTQRELNALKLVTLVAAVTSFFGMNIAFPWEERWGEASWSFVIVLVMIIVITVLFYHLMQKMIYNRYFAIRSR